MAKTSVENLKARFKRGMYPTEGDFANVFDSYVHKDDGIDIDDVTAENGSKTLTTLLQEFKQEILQDAKDQETQYDDTELKGKVEANEGNISDHESRISNLESKGDYDDSELRGRVETNENNISSLESRVSTNESGISDLESRISNLESKDGYDDSDLQNRVSTNEGNISDLEGRVSTNESNISGHEDRITALENKDGYDDSDLQNRVSTNEGNISSLESRVSTNESDIQTLKDDLDTAEDYIAGHESRIQALEGRAEVPEGLAEFIEKVNSFLEDSDATDAAINKWKEIEEFLNGVTDTETLTGMLADLKEEILGEIPEQKEYTAGEGIEISEDGVISLKKDENKLDCLKVVADLDACNAPKGTVAIYTGATNEKYTHGFIYEKTGVKRMSALRLHINGPLYDSSDNNAQPACPAGDYEAEWHEGFSSVTKLWFSDGKGNGFHTTLGDIDCDDYDKDVCKLEGIKVYGSDGIRYGNHPGGTMEYVYEQGSGETWTALNVMNVIG